MGSGAVTWRRLNPDVPIIMDPSSKYGGSGNRLDIFNVVGSDEGQYECTYGTGQTITETACLFVPGQFSSVCVYVHDMILMLSVGKMYLAKVVYRLANERMEANKRENFALPLLIVSEAISTEQCSS